MLDTKVSYSLDIIAGLDVEAKLTCKDHVRIIVRSVTQKLEYHEEAEHRHWVTRT